MKTYLASFFAAFSYDKEDAERLCEVYDRIVDHEIARSCWDEALLLYRENEQADHARILQLADHAAEAIDVHAYMAELLMYICLSEELERRYQAAGIDETVFHASMLDLRYKLDECKAVKGIVGSFVAGWFAGFFDMTRFALGRLQFEIIPFGRSYEQNGKRLDPDSRVINVHIPRTGTRLDEAACEDAYQQAAVFFADQLGEHTAFVCHSWLLYPENDRILSENSNMVRFMKRYDLINWGTDKTTADLWRLFDTDERHPDRLPTDTSARRRYVGHLKAGGKLGWGHGVFFL